jgi:hypothetical protein
MNTVPRTLLCTIKTAAGVFIEAEPVVGQWYLSVDNRKNDHIVGINARYEGNGDFLSEDAALFDDACGIGNWHYLQETEAPDCLLVVALGKQITKKRIISIFASKALGQSLSQMIEDNWSLLVNIDDVSEEVAIQAILDTELPAKWLSEVTDKIGRQ